MPAPGRDRRHGGPVSVRTEKLGTTWSITIDRPSRRNAIDRTTAEALEAAFDRFEEDDSLCVAVLAGAGGTFCSGADLKAIASGDRNRVEHGGPGPLGPSRRIPTKPVLAAIEGHAVAGGLELALLADLRIAGADAVLGVFCRRFGVPLIDGGTVRLPRLIGRSRALDLVLTGRPVGAQEALSMGLVNRVVPTGQACAEALALAEQLAGFPQEALRNDRLSVYEQEDLSFERAITNELERGMATLASGETDVGARRFDAGSGRGGRFD